jgi:hypothetical protein
MNVMQMIMLRNVNACLTPRGVTGAGRFSNQGYRPRDKIFVHGGEEILVGEPFSLGSDDSSIGNLEISNHILGPRRTLPKHDADHRAYGVDGLIRIGKQQFKWVPVKLRCHTKDSKSGDMGGADQPMTCSNGQGAAHDLKIVDLKSIVGGVRNSKTSNVTGLGFGSVSKQIPRA